MDGAGEIGSWIKQLQDRSVYLRQKAAKALGTVSSSNAQTQLQILTALRSALADHNKYVRLTAAAALSRLAATPDEGISVLVGLLGDEHRDVRAATAAALGELGTLAVSSVPALQQLATDPHPPVRTAAAQAIRRLQG